MVSSRFRRCYSFPIVDRTLLPDCSLSTGTPDNMTWARNNCFGETSVQPAYAPVCAEKGLVTLAIDSWCFGERKHEPNGHEGEENTFKQMLWQGRVLWGMMMLDEFRALSYLAGRTEVDPSRMGAFGMSMGATKAWWLGALDPRVKRTMDVCCLTITSL